MKKTSLPRRYQTIGWYIGSGIAALIGFLEDSSKLRFGGPVSSDDLAVLVFGMFIGGAIGGYAGRVIGKRKQQHLPPEQLALEHQLEEEENKRKKATAQVPGKKVLSGWAVYSLIFSWLPVIGLLVALKARKEIRSRPDALYGITIAWIALVIGALSTLGIATVTICGLFVWK